MNGFRQTSDILSAIQLFRNSTMTGSTWKEIFKVLSGSREQWVPDLDDTTLYTVEDIRLVTTDFAAANADPSGQSAFL